MFFLSPVWATSPLSGFNGARPLALGNAYVALSDDVYSFYTNPAGLTGLKLINFFSTYSQLDSNQTYSSLGAVLPKNQYDLTVGVGYRRISVTGFQVSSMEVDFTDQEIGLALAKELAPGTSIGAVLHYISRGLSQGTSSANGSGQALDLAVKRVYRPWLRLGLCAQDLLGRINYIDGTSADLPYSLVAGASFDLLGRNAYIVNASELTIDLDMSETAGTPLLFRSGVEWRLSPQVALRFGIDQNIADTPALSPQQIITYNTQTITYNNLTFGLGLHYDKMQIDYAMRRNGDPTGDVTHYLSFGYELAGPTVEASPPARKKPAGEQTAEVPIVRTIRIKHFADVPAAFWGQREIELLATAGIMWGYADGNFYPNNAVTVDEFNSIVPVDKSVALPFVPDEEKLITRQAAAQRLKIIGKLDIKGKIDRLRSPITRAELARMIYQTDWGQAAVKKLPNLEE